MDNNSTDAGSMAAQLKLLGNQAMNCKEYRVAINFYSTALSHTRDDAVLLANRAAAYLSINEYGLAKTDAQAAVAANPNYFKGWSRLGMVEYLLADYAASAAAYRTGVGNGGTDLTRKGYKQAKMALDHSTANFDMDPYTSLADIIISTSVDETEKYRIEGRVCAAKYNGQIEALVEKLKTPDRNIGAIEQDVIFCLTTLVQAVAKVAAFKGKVIAFTHTGNSFYTPPSVSFADLGELLSERRFIPKDHLSSSLQACYPSGYDTVVLAISKSNEEGHFTEYLIPTNEEGSCELMMVVLDEGQTTLPSNPQWYRGGRYLLVRNISNADLIKRLNAMHAQLPIIEIVLLPGITWNGKVFDKSLVQVRGRSLITRSQLATRIQDRIRLCSKHGIQVSHISRLENYLKAVSDEMHSWTRERVIQVSGEFIRGE